MKNLNLVKKFEIATILKDQNEADIFLAINQSEASWLAYQYGCLFLSQRMSDDWNRAEAIKLARKKSNQSQFENRRQASNLLKPFFTILSKVSHYYLTKLDL